MGVRGALCYVIFVTVICNVSPWTIDLPEVRKYYFERYDSQAQRDGSKIVENGVTFDNINGDSPHNTNEDYNYYYNLIKNGNGNNEDYNVYANSFKNYESYMVRKVKDTLRNGTAYMDGLRLSIERYILLLENCSRLNFTQDLPPEMTSPLSIGKFTGIRDYTTSCREATAASEHVRRLSELALHTTRRLQDVAYTSKYNKNDAMEENELLLRLAWYLDKLAQLTGYDPDPPAHTTTETPPEAAAPTFPLPLPAVSDETRTAILNCLRSNSSERATERCAFRVPQPLLRQVAMRFNVNESAFRLDVPLPSRVSRRSSDDTSLRSNDDISFPAQDPELLIAADNKYPSAVKTVRKRSVTDSENPLIKVLKYYAKHKIWINSNPVSENSDVYHKMEPFDVKNGLHLKQKRSIDSLIKINRIPEDPIQDLSKYVKSKQGIHYKIDRNEVNQIKASLKAKNKKILANNEFKKILRRTRAVPVEHVRETIKTNTDIHYDIPKDLTDKIKSALHHIPVAISHIPPLIDPHGLRGHLDHLEHFDHIKHDHLQHVGHVEHVKNIDYHYADPAEKLKAAIHHIHAKKVQIAKKIETLRKIFRPKRSIGYVNPRIPQDPQQDLSYYVKSKSGTSFNPDLAQAASLRLSLEAAFQRGNINVVHKYGANYNPLIPAPYYAGLLRSLADS